MISENEPGPYQVINENGEAPVLITCDHASNRIPESLCGLSIAPSLLQQHIAYDIGAKQVAIEVAKRLDAPLLVANYSRLVIDLNRHLEDESLIPEISDHVDIVGNRGLSKTAREMRIDGIFKPYHDKHSELVDRLEARHQSPIIFAVHSFTPIMEGFERPWHYGVLWDQCENLSARMVNVLRKHSGLYVGENQPYHARKPLGYSMVVHAQSRGIDIGLLEIRQDLISTPEGELAAADIVYDLLTNII